MELHTFFAWELQGATRLVLGATLHLSYTDRDGGQEIQPSLCGQKGATDTILWKLQGATHFCIGATRFRNGATMR